MLKNAENRIFFSYFELFLVSVTLPKADII